jgi:tRNA (cytidine/uridine-2'-O-)-methyltransferase
MWNEAHSAAVGGVRLALFEPDIPQNTGTILRLAACLGIGVDLIEPSGFPITDRAFRRAGMDYIDAVAITRHVSFELFDAACRAQRRRLVLATTKAAMPYTAFKFAAKDTILLGRESAGVPDAVHQGADARIVVPMRPGLRSLNVAMAAAMILGEALRQTSDFPTVTEQQR